MEGLNANNTENIEKIRSQLIDNILAGKHDSENDNDLANYRATFLKGEEPLFVNIWSVKRGHQLGYIVLHDFLMKVGKGNIFSSTDFEPDGVKLFEKAAANGLIKQISEKSGLNNITRWKIVGDPRANLEKLKNIK
jgi:hypothetical protein